MGEIDYGLRRRVLLNKRWDAACRIAGAEYALRKAKDDYRALEEEIDGLELLETADA